MIDYSEFVVQGELIEFVREVSEVSSQARDSIVGDPLDYDR